MAKLFPENLKLRKGSIVSAVALPACFLRRESLYRVTRLCAFLLLSFFAMRNGFAQGDKPQLKRPSEDRPDKPEEKKKVKKEKDPRAVGVLELHNGKGTLVPVAILVNGRFYDAAAYKADPIPMALESGTVYEAEQAGESQGLFTVIGALKSTSPGSAHSWVGSGKFVAGGAEVEKTTRKAEDVPVGIDSNGDEPPRLTRKNASKGEDTPTAAEPAKSEPAKSDAAKKEDDKQNAKETGANSPPAGETKQPSAGAVPNGDGKASSGTAEGKATTVDSPGSAQNSNAEASTNYYRPMLRRGKPTQAAPEDEGNTSAKKVSPATADKEADTGAVEPGQTMAAISDAGGPGPQSYKFFWKTGEEEERQGQMLALAKSEVRAYRAALVRNQIPAKPTAAHAAAGKHSGAAKPLEPVLEDVKFRGFDLWVTNQPTMILSAEARFPVAPGTTAPAGEPYSITLVARTDIYGSLRKVFSGVTDKFHLDVTPRLELIDAVDADGDGRAELLFRETSDAGIGFVIYRVTADKLWKMFDSLNAE